MALSRFGDLSKMFVDMWQRVHVADRVERPKAVPAKPRAPKPRVNYMHNYRLLRRKKLAARQ
jgi:hypothetical protein